MRLHEKWAVALQGMRLKHPNRVSKTVLTLDTAPEPMLIFALDKHHCSVDDHVIEGFTVSCITLAYWPGLTLARIWMAAAWVGYLQHEALEGVLAPDGTRVLDPHGPGFADRGLRQGVPAVLTPESLRASLCAVMCRKDADALIAKYADSE